jgi:hypothetical protein
MQIVNNETLIKRIKNHFPIPPPPADENIVNGIFPPVQYDNVEIFNFFHNKKWNELSDEFFRSHGAIQMSLGFLTTEAFFYFLPAVMIFILGPLYDWTSTCLLTGIIDRLTPRGANNNHYSEFEKYLNEMPVAQKYIILDFLKLVKSKPGDFCID